MADWAGGVAVVSKVGACWAAVAVLEEHPWGGLAGRPGRASRGGRREGG